MLGGFTQLGGPSPTARADGTRGARRPGHEPGHRPRQRRARPGRGYGGPAGDRARLARVGQPGARGVDLLPGAPLDGGRVLRALLWWRLGDRDRAAMVAARAGRMLGIVLVAVGLLNAFAGSAAGLWLALVGLVHHRRSHRRAGGSARRAPDRCHRCRRDDARPVVAPEWWTVDQMVAHLCRHGSPPGLPAVGLDGAHHRSRRPLPTSKESRRRTAGTRGSACCRVTIRPR